jgi:hypothetical protein
MDGIDADLAGDFVEPVVAYMSSSGPGGLRAALEPNAPGAVIAAEAARGDTMVDVYIYVEEGETLLNDEAADKRQIGWGLFDNNNLPNVTDLGWELFLRGVAWILNDVYVGTSPIPFENKIDFWYANNSLFLNLEGSTRTVDIKIFDITGKLVLQKQVLGGNQVSIPMEKYSSGVYIFMGEDFSGKFVKQ